MRVPDVYIIGAQKSGTTTLYDWLAQHPQIYGHPLAKDYPYFSDDLTWKEGGRRFQSLVKGARPSQLALGGEANSMYAPLAAQRMHATMPEAKLIAILREPVARAYSAYVFAVERLLESRSFEQAIEDELRGYHYEPRDGAQRDYLAHGHYARQLRAVFRYFPREQVKVMLFEDLKREPLQVLDNLFSWLGIEQGFVPDMSIKNKTRGRVRYKWLARLTVGSPNSSTIRSMGKVILPYPLRTAIRRRLAEWNRVPAPKPEFPDVLRQRLREYYRDEIFDLEHLLGMDLAVWKVE